MAENTIPNDPMILLSFVNTKLRDFYPSLDKMCDDLGCSKEEIESKLSAIDYTSTSISRVVLIMACTFSTGPINQSSKST